MEYKIPTLLKEVNDQIVLYEPSLEIEDKAPKYLHEKFYF